MSRPRQYLFLDREPTKAEVIKWALSRLATERNPPRRPNDKAPDLAARDKGEVARLIRKYGRSAVVGAVELIQLPRPGRRAQANPFRPIRPLTPSDTRDLARLVRKCGRNLIVETAKSIPEPREGRPPRGDLPVFERIHLADWIDEVAMEYQEAGSVKPYRQAELEVYEMQFGGDGNRPDLQTFLTTLKRKRIQGRKESRAARDTAQRRERALKSQRPRRK